MPIRRITSEHVTEAAPGLWSNCLVVGDIAYMSGLTARGKEFDTILGFDEYEQTKVILNKHKALVEAAGGKMADFTKLTIYVTRIENRHLVWNARKEFFQGDFPACSLVEVSSLAHPEILVEIEGVAHIGHGAY
ncbi:RidA family protein [Ensifer sp. ENS06]|uniref:RidA family protein n=1 Tax=Ensifer sp. ENS06 TaxID=2769276 RepID=UPI001784DAC0|nr:RidA family protein [Ensifer sp. ENS06]MBD9627079.1 RidA family protein [Ensifer sp. ENS06]